MHRSPSGIHPDGAGGVVGEMERLARLLDQGYLTREEFESLKRRLL